WAHRYLCCGGFLVPLYWKRKINWISGLLQKDLRWVIHAHNLALCDAQDAKWLAQFIDVSGLRSQFNELYAWRQNALIFSWVARGEDNLDRVDRFITNRQSLAYIRKHGTDARVAFCQVSRCVWGDV